MTPAHLMRLRNTDVGRVTSRNYPGCLHNNTTCPSRIRWQTCPWPGDSRQTHLHITFHAAETVGSGRLVQSGHTGRKSLYQSAKLRESCHQSNTAGGRKREGSAATQGKARELCRQTSTLPSAHTGMLGEHIGIPPVSTFCSLACRSIAVRLVEGRASMNSEL